MNTTYNKISDIEYQLQQVKVVMKDNVETLIENKESLEQLQLKTEIMDENAKLFKNNSQALKRQMRWKYIRNSLIILVLCLLLIGIIVLALHPWKN